MDIIAVVAFDGINPFHLSVPCLVFGEEQPSPDMTPCEIRICTPGARPIMSTAGFTVDTGYGLGDLADASTVIVPSWPDPEEPAPLEMIDTLRGAHENGSLLVGLCLGAFVIADTGLLDNRPAATHWKWADVFKRRFPSVKLNQEALYVDDGDVVTSAGTTAAIDTCLHLLRRRHGVTVTNRVARRIVAPPHREGGQAQYIEHPLPPDSGSNPLASTLRWALENLDQSLSVDELARQAAMSRRTFTRAFRNAVGTSVSQWISTQRIAMAQHLLETSDFTIEHISGLCGFGSAVTQREAFVRTLGTTPSAYRRTFQGPEKDLAVSASPVAATL